MTGELRTKGTSKRTEFGKTECVSGTHIRSIHKVRTVYDYPVPSPPPTTRSIPMRPYLLALELKGVPQRGNWRFPFPSLAQRARNSASTEMSVFSSSVKEVTTASTARRR
ncbi:hypothetical protein TNCV_3176441 [Trichonephila clavipes]|nr:hypothetical protein TNCV_3176441 [Trichonephila clavipes]